MSARGESARTPARLREGGGEGREREQKSEGSHVRTRVSLCEHTHVSVCAHACLCVSTRVSLCAYTRVAVGAGFCTGAGVCTERRCAPEDWQQLKSTRVSCGLRGQVKAAEELWRQRSVVWCKRCGHLGHLF